MSFKSKVNVYRRKITRRITRNLGTSQSIPVENIDVNAIKRILVCRPNHRLGNQLMLTPLIQELESDFPGCTIDLFTKGGLAPILFANYSSVDKFIMLPKKVVSNLANYTKVWLKLKLGTYDLVINVDKNSSSGRVSTNFAKANWKIFGEYDDNFFEKYPDAKHMAKFPVYILRDELEKIGAKTDFGPVPSLNLNLSREELQKGKEVLNSIVPDDKKAICIYTFATGTKCYSKEWWLDFYERLKNEFPQYNIYEMLPIENISNVDRKAPTFYSKDIREMSSVLANSAIWIGADCGVMHLASASQTPTIGLFAVTPIEKYKPYNPGSKAVYTDQTDTETLLKLIRETLTETEKR